MDRLRGWMESDLVGIPVTLAAVAVFAIGLIGFWVAGSIGGVLFAVLGLGLVLLLVVRPGSKPPAGPIAGPRSARKAGRAERGRIVLVVANRGLAGPALAEWLQRSETRGAEIRIVAPAAPESRLEKLADDFDAERRAATLRLEALLKDLRAASVNASGHVDGEADPRSALDDGLREFAAARVVLVRGDEPGWPAAVERARELRRTGIDVVELDGGGGAPAA